MHLAIQAAQAGPHPISYLCVCSLSKREIIHGSHLDLFLLTVRHIPFWFPGAWWSRHGRHWQPTIKDILELPFESARKQMVYLISELTLITPS
jgi:hypothetical protein